MSSLPLLLGTVGERIALSAKGGTLMGVLGFWGGWGVFSPPCVDVSVSPACDTGRSARASAFPASAFPVMTRREEVKWGCE